MIKTDPLSILFVFWGGEHMKYSPYKYISSVLHIILTIIYLKIIATSIPVC